MRELMIELTGINTNLATTRGKNLKSHFNEDMVLQHTVVCGNAPCEMLTNKQAVRFEYVKSDY